MNRIAPPSKVAEAPELLGVYTAHRVGTLAGVNGYTIGQWARYGLIRPTFHKGLPAHLYSFYDAAEAVVIHWLRAKGFSYAQIHKAIDRAREDHPEWPLLKAPLGVAHHSVDGDPRGMIVLEVRRGVYVDTERRNEAGAEQITLRPELLDGAREMLRRGGWIAEQLDLRRIEVDPTKVGGQPTLRGRRWPVERVAQIGADDEGRTILIEDYGLDPRDVDESVRWVEAAAAL
jgi:uncharacterized protein (DUF433 family)